MRDRVGFCIALAVCLFNTWVAVADDSATNATVAVLFGILALIDGQNVRA